MKIERIGIVFDRKKPAARQLALKAKDWLEKKGCKASIQPLPNENQGLDLIVTFGGDGFILHTANTILSEKLSIPLLRVNFGKRGFLANIEPEKLFEELNKVLEDNYIITRRTRIEVEIQSGIRPAIKTDALNDVVIERTQTRTVLFRVNINKKEDIEREGDGLIFSTRTGASAYNRSASGPILIKEDRFVLTVISPVDPEKSFYFVRPANSVFKVNNIEGYVRVVVDGNELVELSRDDSVVIKRSSKNTLFMELGDL